MTEHHENAPNWNLLPHEPTRFFGLADGFQRNDLKKSYTRLIKHFKPDKFPEEFQRIRAAYEELDHGLRYGKVLPQSSGLLPATSPGPLELRHEISASPSAQTTAQATESPWEMTTRLLEEDSLSGVYRQLADKDDKSASEYYMVAVLSDFQQGKQQGDFVEWILRGVEAHPADQGLWQLMHAAMKSGIGDVHAQAFLPRIAAVCSSDVFYAVSESVWLRLLESVPFDEFSDLLARCESKTRGHQIHSKAIFDLQLLRASLFRAPDEWVKHRLQEVERNYEYVPEYLQVDLEVTAALARYRLFASGFANGNPLRQALHDTIVEYSMNGEEVACRAVARFQAEHAGKWEVFAQAFPLDGSDHATAWNAWYWVNIDASQKMQVPVHPQDPDQVIRAVDHLLGRLHQRDHSRVQATCLGVHTGITCVLVFVGAFFGGVGLTLIPGLSSQKYDAAVFIVSTVGPALLYLLFGRPFVSRSYRAKRLADRDEIYRTLWRTQLFKLLDSVYGNWSLVSRVLHSAADNNSEKEYPVLHAIHEKASHDTGLAFYDVCFMFVQ